MADKYDVIIVGGGSAGCVAASASFGGSRTVKCCCSKRARPWPLPELVADASKQTRLLLESDFVSMFGTQRHLDGSTYYALAGRIMGGGSSVNVMSVLRPQRYDLDQWVAAGNPDWTYERCLPFMKKIESDQDFPDDPIHGKDGPLYVKRHFTLDMDRCRRRCGHFSTRPMAWACRSVPISMCRSLTACARRLTTSKTANANPPWSPI